MKPINLNQIYKKNEIIIASNERRYLDNKKYFYLYTKKQKTINRS